MPGLPLRHLPRRLAGGRVFSKSLRIDDALYMSPLPKGDTPKRTPVGVNGLRHENAFGVVSQGAVPEVGDDHLALVIQTLRSARFATLVCSGSAEQNRRRSRRRP